MKPRIHIALARRFRRTANAPEAIAWDALRTLRTQGFPVRRQYPIGKFIVDFAITRTRLVVEVDGAIHGLESVAERDVERDAEIKRAGWRVLRVPAATAMSKDHVLAMIQQELRL
jgi:very-short-patch-repair endonuclease